MTILVPAMLDETFELLKAAFASENVKVVLLKNSDGIINTGLEFVHNDLCCPCAIMVGQLFVRTGGRFVQRLELHSADTQGGEKSRL